ncbi:MAG: cell division protease FtsH [Frankiaceae bacterium]|jgi:ATP-dependent Zn protease|nr:cell division protease FtsH [Frankiaceae bacterium]
MDLTTLSTDRVVTAGGADVGVSRERSRLRRLRWVALVIAGTALWMWIRLLEDKPPYPVLPHPSGKFAAVAPMLLLVVILGAALLLPLLMAGRSPHVLYRSSEIDTSFDDVKGSAVVVEEVVKTLNLFLAHKSFKEQMGGTARRAILFEGPPGTGKTYLAKAMAKEAGVPFLFVSSSAFQSMYYGQTNRKIRSYFKALRKAARKNGGAIGFIEEIDAVGASRAGMGGAKGEGITGVVNELLIQLQSFDEPPSGRRMVNHLTEVVNTLLPTTMQIRKAPLVPANILVIGATNRATDLDPALLRPGRFDRSIYFDLPSRSGRREIIDYYLGKKSHDAELDSAALRDRLAAMTSGYSPVMIEHLFDEALVWAVRRGAPGLSWADVQRAKMTEEIGLAQPVEYTEAEQRTIATHEAGHAVVAWLVGKSRKLEVLTIVKRKEALGLLAHSDLEERFLKSQSEMHALVQIALGGMVAEQLFFGEITSGPASDLKAATIWAATMIGSLGMDGSLFSYEAVDAPHANIVSKVSSTDEGKARIESLLERAREEVRVMLTDNRGVVEGLRDVLLERQELIGDEITDAISVAAARVPASKAAPDHTLI